MELAPSHFVRKALLTFLITVLNLGAPEHPHQQQGPCLVLARCPALSRFTERKRGWGDRKATRTEVHPKREPAFGFLILIFDFQA